ncbi:MAG: tetratricopeptide repeat protein [Candidatus Freyarchaeum deiterrae]
MGKIKVGVLIGGRFEVRRILGGEGKSGMGALYACIDHKSGAVVALKTFQDRYLKDQEAREDFKREALAWTQLEKHPNIVRAIGFEEFDSRPFIILEFIVPDEEGRNTLAQHLQKPIPLQQTLKRAIQFCRGMEHAAAHGVTPHRDINPNNIMITRDGTLKITDFGLAKLWDQKKPKKGHKIQIDEGRPELTFIQVSEERVLAGTPPWMAPEQFEGKADTRSDIYSFGIVLFQMVNKGKLPFQAQTDADYYQAHKTRPVPQLKSKLFPVIERCLQKNPKDRYQNFQELRKDLEKIYQQETRSPPPKPPKKTKLEAWEYNNQGLSFYNLGLLDEAIREYKEAIGINPDYADAHNNLGNALKDKGLLDEAISEYTEALKINPDYADTHSNLGVALRGKGMLDEAIQEYREALRIKPTLTEAHSNLGNALTEQGLLDDAIQEYREALSIKPDLAKTHSDLGNALVDKGLLDEAIQEYREALRINPADADAHSNLGVALKSKGQLNKAIREYREAIKIKPTLAEAHSNLGNALKDKGLLDEAIKEWKEAIKINPEYAEAYNNLGVALEALGDFKGAIEAYQKFIKNAPPQYAQQHVKRARQAIRALKKMIKG